MTERIEIVREDHPFDRGYWLRWDGFPRPNPNKWQLGSDGVNRVVDPQELEGWDACDDDLRFDEAQRRAA